jgi:hypothetical protein
MEEKKLTDEEIVKALECCANRESCIGYECCLYSGQHTACVEMGIDIIHSLQADNERLKEQCSKSSYKDSWKNKFFKAQEEIERLTEDCESAYAVLEAQRHLIDLIKKDKAELQKQVDELKTFIDFKTANVMCDKCKQQAVKDTAKEILSEVNSCIEQGQEYCGLDWRGLLTAKNLILLWCKKKGVEVE